MGTAKPAISTVKFLLAASTALMLAAHAGDEVSDAARKQGLAKAPAMIKASGIPCTVTDARKLPPRVAADTQSDGARGGATTSASNGGGHSSVTGSSAGGSATQSFTLELDYGPGLGAGLSSEEYEVACGEGLGYVVGTVTGQKPFAYLCIEARSARTAAGGDDAAASGVQPVNQCLLAGNADSAQLLAVNALIAKSGVHCDATRVRGIGHNAQSTMVEAACSSGDGYILQGSNPLRMDQPIHAVNCMGRPAGDQVSCRLTDTAAQLAAAAALLHQAQPECQVAARRYVGSSTTGGHFFEFRCEDSKGYLLMQGPAGELAGTVACTDAAVARFGGCTLQPPSK
jgi:hypothetical protein